MNSYRSNRLSIILCGLSLYRYSGEFSDFGVHIDDIASIIWENVSNHRYLVPLPLIVCAAVLII